MSVETVTAATSGMHLREGDGVLLNRHLEEYGLTCREVALRLVKVWNDVGLDANDQSEELAEVTRSIMGVWKTALKRAEEGREILGEEVEMAMTEIARLKVQLADDDGDFERDGAKSEASVDEEDEFKWKTLKEKYEGLLAELEKWRAKRAERMGEFEDVLSEMWRFRARLGQPMPRSAQYDGQQLQDISRKHLDYLRYELVQSQGELQRRERELEGLLSWLRKTCFELGEDDVEIAATVHSSLRFYPQLLPNLCAFRPSYCAPLDPEERIPEGVELSVSDATFAALEAKINEMKNVKIVRQQQALEMTEILRNLWTALGVQQNDVDRGIFTRLLEGPSRLHLKSLERCMKEVNRLEQEQAKLLLGLINAKKTELESLCNETRLPMPDLSPLLPIENEKPPSCGQIADSLAKLVRMVAEVNLIAEKRVGIVKMITDLEGLLGECKWLYEFENDGSRYSGRGRDANQKLQRALRAGKIRDKMPEKMKRLQELIQVFEQSEGQPFMFDNKNYREVLDSLLGDIETQINGAAAERHAHKNTEVASRSRRTVLSRAASTNGTLGRGVVRSRSRETAPSRASSVGSRTARSVDAVRSRDAPSRAGSIGAGPAKGGRSAGIIDSQKSNLRRCSSVQPKPSVLPVRGATTRLNSSSSRSTPRSSSGHAPSMKQGSATRLRSASRVAERRVPDTVPEQRRVRDSKPQKPVSKKAPPSSRTKSVNGRSPIPSNAGCRTEMQEPRHMRATPLRQEVKQGRISQSSARRPAYNPVQERLYKLLENTECSLLITPATLSAGKHQKSKASPKRSNASSPLLAVVSSGGEEEDRRVSSSSSRGTPIGVGYYEKESSSGEMTPWRNGKDDAAGFYVNNFYQNDVSLCQDGAINATTKKTPRKTPRRTPRKTPRKPPSKSNVKTPLKSPRGPETASQGHIVAHSPHWSSVYCNRCYMESPVSSDLEDAGETDCCGSHSPGDLTAVPDDSSDSPVEGTKGPITKDSFIPTNRISHDRKDSDYVMNGRLSV